MTRWFVVGAVVAGLVAMLIVQQRRLDRLESAVKGGRAGAVEAAPESSGGGASTFAVDPAPRVRYVPVPVPVAGNSPVATGGGSTGGQPAAPGGGTAAATPPPPPGYAGRPTVAERYAQTPAHPTMVDAAPVRDFVEQNHIDQGQWNALVKANDEWVQTLNKVKQHGVTAAPGPLDKLAQKHDENLGIILGDQNTVDGWKKLQQDLTTPKVSVQFGGRTYQGAHVE
jgi:hypothetical protein